MPRSSSDRVGWHYARNLVSTSRITLDGKHPGLEVRANLNEQPGIARSRIYLVEGRLYQLTVAGTEPRATSADADRFLNSLVVTQ